MLETAPILSELRYSHKIMITHEVMKYSLKDSSYFHCLMLIYFFAFAGDAAAA